MIAYCTLGTNDLERGAAFYDKVAEALGQTRTLERPRLIRWGDRGAGALVLIKPYDGQPASVGNGVMVALKAASREQVDSVHKLALGLGAVDEGAPGERAPGFYAAYFRDLDGNKLMVASFE